MKISLSNVVITSATAVLMVFAVGCDKAVEESTTENASEQGNNQNAARETAEKIQDAADETLEQATEKAEELRSTIEKTANDLGAKADETAEEVRQDAEEAGKRIENMLREQLKNQGAPQQ